MSARTEFKRRLFDTDLPLSKRAKLAERAILDRRLPVRDAEEIVLRWIIDNLSEFASESGCGDLAKVIDFKRVSENTERRLFEVLKRGEGNAEKEIPLEFELHLLKNESIHSRFRRRPSEYFLLAANALQSILSRAKDAVEEGNRDVLAETFRFANEIFGRIFDLMKRSGKTTMREFVESGVFGMGLKFSELDGIPEGMKRKIAHSLFPDIPSMLRAESLDRSVKIPKFAESIERRLKAVRFAIAVLNSLVHSSDRASGPSLRSFVEMFVLRFKSDESLVFAFYILAMRRLHLSTEPSDEVEFFSSDKNDACVIFAEMLRILKRYDISPSAPQSSDAESSGDVKHLFAKSVREVVWKIINDETVSCENRLIVTNRTLDLEPLLIEPHMEGLLMTFFTFDSGRLSPECQNLVTRISVIILEIKFKTGRSTEFFNSLFKGFDGTNDVRLPSEFCEKFGELSAGMIPQHAIKIFEVFFSLFETTKFLRLPVLQLLGKYFYYSKMANENIVSSIIKEFIELFDKFGNDILYPSLKTFAIKKSNNEILETLLETCFNYGALKMLLWKYQGNYHFEREDIKSSITDEILKYDITFLHSSLSSKQWKKIQEAISTLDRSQCCEIMDLLILQNISALMTFFDGEDYDIQIDIDMSSLVPKILNNFKIRHNYHILLSLNEDNSKLIARCAMENYKKDSMRFNEVEKHILKSYSNNSKTILSAFAVEHARFIWSIFEDRNASQSLFSSSSNKNFDIKTHFSSEVTFTDYVNSLNLHLSGINANHILNILELWALMPIEHFDEHVQLSILCSVVLIKLASNKLLEQCNKIIMKIFELSYKTPNLLGIMSFENLFYGTNPVFPLIGSVSEMELCRLVIKKMIDYLIIQNEIDGLKSVLKSLKKRLSSEDTRILHCDLQLTSIVIVALSDINKYKITSDSKSSLKICAKKYENVLQNVFENLDWEYFDKEFQISNRIKSNYLTSSENENLYKSSWNLSDYYILTINRYLNEKSPDSQDLPGHILKPMNFFLNNSIYAIFSETNDNSCTKVALSLINIVLKNWALLGKNIESQDMLWKHIWIANLTFLKNVARNQQDDWSEILDLVAENTKLIFELCDSQIFHKFIVEHMMNLANIEGTDFSVNENEGKLTNAVLSKVWSPFLHANLKDKQKCDVRVNLIKRIFINFYMWMMNYEANDKFYKNSEISLTYLDIIIQSIGMKKIQLTRHVIDYTIQLPTLISSNATNLNKENINHASKYTEKSLSLLTALVYHRSEMIQDRWQTFLQAYRTSMCNIFSIANPNNSDESNENQFVSLAHKLEKLTMVLVKNQKQDLSRIAAYIIADIVNNFEKNSTIPSVKFHIENCVYLLLQLADNYAVGFLMRTMNETCTIIFQSLYDNYVKFYKYTGTY